ncbi:MAG: zinc-dependent metalloprotease, partial [Bacteroidetes bacterium]|nr:zinc-dependent metalloprotease [Fibrella sp.]
VKKHANDPRCWFGTETNPLDPRSQSEDLGDNAMIASAYGIKNLKRILPNLTQWTGEEAEDYDKLREMYGEVTGQFRRYMGHVTKYVGGVYESPRTYDQAGAVYVPTPHALQKSAVTFLNQQLFQTPMWMLDTKIMELVRPDQGVDFLRTLQETTLNSLMDVGRLTRLIENSSNATNAYSLDEFMTDLQTGIWRELKAGRSIDVYRRNLQKVYAEKLIAMLNPSPALPAAAGFSGNGFRYNAGPVADVRKSDIMSEVRAQLVDLQQSIRVAVPRQTDKMSRYHLSDVLARIDRALDPRRG